MYLKTEGHKKVEYLKTINPIFKVNIGQVGGLDTDVNGDLMVFHRGSRIWDFEYLLFKKKTIFF